MEDFFKSSSALSDFEFKYIPKKEFERIVTRVQRDRKLKLPGMWGDFCCVSSTLNEDIETLPKKKPQSEGKVLSDDEIRTIIQSIDNRDVTQKIPASSAPLFGPARKLHVKTLLREQSKSKSPSVESVSSVHIVEEVSVAEQLSEDEVQVKKNIDVEKASVCSSIEDEKESLQLEMRKLCYEIEKANGTKADDDDSSVDLTYQDERVLRTIMDKTEEKVVCESNRKFIDKKFDFLYDECKNNDDEDTEAQTLPVVELKKKASKSGKLPPDDDSTNDNNVWIPKTENQIRKSGRRESEKAGAMKKKRNDEVFPCDVVSQNAREVGRLKRDVNEKSQVDVKPQSPKDDAKLRAKDGNLHSKADILSALGKVNEHQAKVCQYLEYLREIIEDPPEIEDVNDLRKRQKRAIEFSNRFARNHLYQIGRLAEDIRVMPDNPMDLAAKVNSLFQVMMQAVQTYLKNVEMFIYNKHPDKLLVLVDFIINAMKICFDREMFDKRDLVIQQMLRKCSEMKRFLEMNQRSTAKFASISEKQKKSMSSRNSFAFENPYERKLSMYDAPAVRKRAVRPVPNPHATKSPYDAPKPRNLRSSRSIVNSRAKVSTNRTSRDPPSRIIASPNLKKTGSNISTAVEKLKENDSSENIKSVHEKPLEDLKTIVPRVENQKEYELMEMIQNVTKEKIEEMLLPFLAKLRPKHDDLEQETSMEDLNLELIKKVRNETLKTKTPTKRVSSDLEKPPNVVFVEHTEEEKTRSLETVQRISKNVQYYHVKSNEAEKAATSPALINQSSSQTHFNNSKNRSISFDGQLPSPKPRSPRNFKIISANSKPPPSINTKQSDEKIIKDLKEQALKDRLNYISQMMENPLYVNESHSEPWRMFAGISDMILDEMLKSVVAELDFGEKLFVENFLRHELEC